MNRARLLALAAIACLPLGAEDGNLVAVAARQGSRVAELPGEFLPFLNVSLHAKVAGFVERVHVDRGSVVREGQLLVELSAPELAARIAGAQSRVQSAEAERAQAEAQLAALRSTYQRLQKAAQTAGAVAGNELVQLEQQVAAGEALVAARAQAAHVAQAAVDAEKQAEAYLHITAPFDGVITDRLVHPGALVGPGADAVLLVVQQISRLRLVVAVPEAYVGGIAPGTRLSFTVPAYPGRTWTAAIARSSHTLDKATRTMAVELDVPNRDGALSPGMYPSVKWIVHHTGIALFVPKTSVVTTTERTFVVRSHEGRAEWVDVRKGAADGDLVEVSGALKAGDLVVRRATDEMREGSPLAGSK